MRRALYGLVVGGVVVVCGHALAAPVPVHVQVYSREVCVTYGTELPRCFPTPYGLVRDTRTTTPNAPVYVREYANKVCVFVPDHVEKCVGTALPG